MRIFNPWFPAVAIKGRCYYELQVWRICAYWPRHHWWRHCRPHFRWTNKDYGFD